MLVTLLLSGFIILSLSTIVVLSRLSTSVPSATEETSSLPTAAPTVTEHLYWSYTCPHCHDTLEWLATHDAQGQLAIEKREVSQDKNNATALSEAAANCGLANNAIGVPFLVTATEECLIGTPDIIAHFDEELTALQTTPSATPAAIPAATEAATLEAL